MQHRRNNEVDNAFNLGYKAGYYNGKGEVLGEIKKILDDSEYPEYLEMDIVDYLKQEGVINEQNY